MQRAREKFPDADFKIFIREAGMTHVRTSPYYPQSNGKIEAWNKTVKVEAIRLNCPRTREEAEALVEKHVRHHNHVRLHSGIGWITPADKLAGREVEIWAERDRRLEVARETRRQMRLCA